MYGGLGWDRVGWVGWGELVKASTLKITEKGFLKYDVHL